MQQRTFSEGTAVLPACLGLLVVFAVTSCATLSPEQKAYRKKMRKQAPDLSGRWESNRGHTVDIRQSKKRNLDLSLAGASPGQPTWEPKTSWVRVPTAPGEDFEVVVQRRYPGKTENGKIVRQTRRERLSGRLSKTRDKIIFDNGETWTLVGQAGPLAPPGAGESKYHMTLTGRTIRELELERGNASTCKKACKDEPGCIAVVIVGRKCSLKATLGTPKAQTGAHAWVKPPTKSTPGSEPTAVPALGRKAKNLRLTGVRLDKLEVGKRNARRRCERACEADWSCKGYSVEPWAGKCELFSSVEGGLRANGWESVVPSPRPVAVAPQAGQYTKDARLTTKTIRTKVFVSAHMRDCENECLADEDCGGFSWLRERFTCELKANGDEVTDAKGWTSWKRPPPPKDPQIPPDQTMASPLCQNHLPAAPAYILNAGALFDASSVNPDVPNDRGALRKGNVDLPSFRRCNEDGRCFVNKSRVSDPSTSTLPVYDDAPYTTSYFFLRGLPNGLMHIHAWHGPDIVIKRRGEEIVAGGADAHSAWRLENLWEHVDPPDIGVFYVIRSAEDGRFLARKGSGLELVDTPESPDAQWRFSIPQQKTGEPTPLPVIDPPPIVLDELVLKKLTAWAVTEMVREEQPACWKESSAAFVIEACPQTGQTTDCGAFCTVSDGQCALDVATMILSIAEVALNVAGLAFTGGTANAAAAPARAALKTATKAAAKQALRQVMKQSARRLQQHLKRRIGTRVLKYMKTRGRSESFKKLARDAARGVGKDMGSRVAYRMPEAAFTGAEVPLTPQQQSRAENELAEIYATEVSKRAGAQFALMAMSADDPDLLEIVEMIDLTGVVGVFNAFDKPQCTETPMPEF